MKSVLVASSLLASLTLADIADLQSQLPTCSVQCLADGAKEHGCSVTDIACQCTKIEPMIKTVSPCLAKADCELSEITDVANIVVQICEEAGVSANSSSLANPSKASGDVASQTTSAAAADKTGAASHLQALGWTGAAAAAVAAFVL